MAKNKFFKEIHGVLYEAAESFDAEITITNKEQEEAKTAEKLCFMELSDDNLATCKIYIIKQIKKHKPCFLHSLMSYHSVIHRLGFFIC